MGAEQERFFGLFCPHHRVWLVKNDGILVYYPAKVLAESHLELEKTCGGGVTYHLWIVAEFGKQDRILKPVRFPGDPICPFTATKESATNQ